MRTTRQAVKAHYTAARKKIAQQSPKHQPTPLNTATAKSFGFYNFPPQAREAGKRQLKPVPGIIDHSVLPAKPKATGGRVWGNRVSDSKKGVVVLSETISKGDDVIGSPRRLLNKKIKEEVKGILSPRKFTISEANPQTGSPWCLFKNSPHQSKFVRSFSALLFLGEYSEEAVIKVNIFQSEESAREVKKEGRVSEDIETIRIRLVLPKFDTFTVPETKATVRGLSDADKENRMTSAVARADDIAFLSGEEGAHEHSHAAQKRIFGNIAAAPVRQLQPRGKRKNYAGEVTHHKRHKPEDEKITFAASYEHNSMRTVGPEHRIIFDYIKAGADISYSNCINLFNHVIDREFPEWRVGSNKIKFELVARNAFSPKKVTPAKQLPKISEVLFKFAFGSPKKPELLDEAADHPMITTLGELKL